MQTRGRWNRQNHTFRDEVYSPAEGVSLWEICPQLAALDPAVAILDFEDFIDSVKSIAEFTYTEIGAGGTFAAAAGKGGLVTLTSDALDNDGCQIQRIISPFIPAAGKPIWFEAKLQLVTAAKHVESDMQVGLCFLDTTLIAGQEDGIYFRKDDGDALIDAVTEKTHVETVTAGIGTLAAATWYKFGFFADGVSTVYFYIDGVLVATHTATIPIVALSPSFAFLNGEAGATAWQIDYFKTLQIR
jgi:hypothetical protein